MWSTARSIEQTSDLCAQRRQAPAQNESRQHRIRRPLVADSKRNGGRIKRRSHCRARRCDRKIRARALATLRSYLSSLARARKFKRQLVRAREHLSAAGDAWRNSRWLFHWRSQRRTNRLAGSNWFAALD